MLKCSLLVYQQAAASTALTLSCGIMPLFKMTIQLFFTSRQNSRTFVAHCNVFIHNLKNVIQKMLVKNIDQEIELVLIKQKQYDLDFSVPG